MTTWYVQRGSKVQELDETKLRELLLDRELSGMEAARRRGESDWAPLYEYDVFRQVVPHEGDPALAARSRQAVGLGMHVSAYVIVACIVGFNPWVLGFWGLALAGHAIRSFPALVGLYRHYLRGQPLALQVPAAAAVGSEAPTVPPASTYLAELEQALDALAAALDANDSVRMDPSEFEDIRARARALHLQRIALREVANDDAMARLEAELMDAQHNADQAQDERSAAVYEAEARAILGRLQTMKDAAAAADRIRARERTLLHELEGARLQLLRAGVHEEPLPELVAQLARVKGELEAEAEVDAKLAEAQRVAGAAAPEGVQAGTPTADGEAARRQAAARQSAKRQGLG